MRFTRFNQTIRKFSMPLNIANILVGLLVGILHVYIPIPSLFGLVLGCTMAVAGSVGIGISYYFTAANTNTPTNNKPAVTPELKNTNASNTFLAIALPCMLLNTGACFFGMYTGTILLIAALAVPIAPAMVMALAIGMGTLLALGTLVNSWLQTHHIWERLKAPVMKGDVHFTGTTERLLEGGLEPTTPILQPRPNYQRCFSLPNLAECNPLRSNHNSDLSETARIRP